MIALRDLMDSYVDAAGMCSECRQPMAHTLDELGPVHAVQCSYWKTMNRARKTEESTRTKRR